MELWFASRLHGGEFALLSSGNPAKASAALFALSFGLVPSIVMEYSHQWNNSLIWIGTLEFDTYAVQSQPIVLIADEIDALITVFLQYPQSKITYNTYFDIFLSEGARLKNALSLA